MKLLVNGDQEMATIDLGITGSDEPCRPRMDIAGYRISGPDMSMALVKDDTTDGLRLNLELPGITNAALVIEKSDVKSLKTLMNKDAIKFMLKALM